MSFKYAIALTGGIATGKSTASKLLGFEIIDADKIAHEQLDKSYQEIEKLFGREYTKNKKVNRKLLGKLIFDNPKDKKRLEELLHPLIYREIESRAKKQDRYNKLYIIDIPLFFETNRYPIERSIVVYTPVEKQLERLIKRNGFSLQEAQNRINAQMSIEEKRLKATYLIDNSGDLNALQQECDRVKELILDDL